MEQIKDKGGAKKPSKKEEIALSGLKVFCEKGYAGTTIDDIVKKAKCSHGLFYHYFSTKRSLYDHVMEQRQRTFDATLFNKLEKIKTYKEKLVFIVKNMFDKVRTDENFSYYFFFTVSQFFSNKNSFRLKRPPKDFKPPVMHLEEFIIKGQEAGEFTKNYSAFDLARLLLSIIQGATLGYVIAPKEIQKNMKLPNVEIILDIFTK